METPRRRDAKAQRAEADQKEIPEEPGATELDGNRIRSYRWVGIPLPHSPACCLFLSRRLAFGPIDTDGLIPRRYIDWLVALDII